MWRFLHFTTLLVGAGALCSFEALQEAVEKYGGHVMDGLVLEESTDNTGPRGLWTNSSTSFEAGQVIMQIPKLHFMSEEVGKSAVADIIEKAPTELAGSLLAFSISFLMMESVASMEGGEISKHWLPCLQDASSEWSAAYFTASERNASLISMHGTDVASARWAIDALQDAMQVEEEKAQLAIHLALSRVQRMEEGGEAFLIWAPLVDFMNHDEEANVVVNVDINEEGSCVVAATRDIKPGEQLTHQYTAYGSKFKWIHQYGFLPKKVPGAASTTGAIQNGFDVVLYSGDSPTAEMTKALTALECPEEFALYGFLILSSTEPFGVTEKQLACQQLLQNLKEGMNPSEALDWVGEAKEAKKKVAALCKEVVKKLHTKKQTKALAKLKQNASKEVDENSILYAANQRSKQLLASLTAEYDAMRFCANATGDLDVFLAEAEVEATKKKATAGATGIDARSGKGDARSGKGGDESEL